MPNDITVTKNTTVGSERWDVEYTADQAATVTKTLDTAGTMLDRDIKVSITTPAGSVVTPTTSITANPSISVDSSGLITSSVSASQSVTPAVSVGFVSAGTANPGTVSVSGSNTSQLSTQAGTTISPTESEQTAVAAGKYTTGAVKVGAISSTYVGSGITQRTSSDLSASGATVTAPAGYYANSASKAVASGSVTAPSSISDGGATVTFTPNPATLHMAKNISVTPQVTTAGYISAGTAGTSSVSLSAQAAGLLNSTITPTTTDISLASNGAGPYWLTTSAKVAGDADLIAGNIKKDVSIFGVTGTYEGSSATLQAKTNINPTTSSQTITPDAGYDGLSSVQINAMASGSATTPATTITPNAISISVNSSTGVITASNTQKAQSVTPTVSAGYVSSGTAGTITVSAASNTSQLTTQAAQTITPTTSDQTIAAGKYLTGVQTIKGDANLVAGNIKKDVSIFGVTGTYEGGGGGGGGATLIGSGEITANTTSTSAIEVGSVSIQSGMQNVAAIILVIIRDKAGVRSGYFYGSDSYIYYDPAHLGASYNVGTGTGMRFDSSSGTSVSGSAQSTAYGLYTSQFTYGPNTPVVKIYARYNATRSRTINGTYSVKVYALNHLEGNPYAV